MINCAVVALLLQCLFLLASCQSSGDSSDFVSQLMGMMINELNSSMNGVLTEDMITVNFTETQGPMEMVSGSISDIGEEIDVTTGSSKLTIGTTEYDVLQCLAPVDCMVVEYAGELNTTYFYGLSNETEFVTTDFLSCTGKFCLISRFQELTQLLFEQTLAVPVSPVPITTTQLSLPPLELTPVTSSTQQFGCSCEITAEPLCCDGVDYTNKCIAGCVVDDVEGQCIEGTCSGEPMESSMDLSSMMQTMMENALQNFAGGSRKLTSVAECQEELDPCCPEYEVTVGEDICTIAEKFGSSCNDVKLYNDKETVEAGDTIQVC